MQLSDADGLSLPSYAAATIAYGIRARSLPLLYLARAYDMEKPGFQFLDAGEKGKLDCSPDIKTPISSMPPEIFATVAKHLAKLTLPEATCESWLYFGDVGASNYHPTYCCSHDRPAEHQWPTVVYNAFSAARELFVEHFTVTVPRCEQPCHHHACELVYAFLGRWTLCLADCPMEGEDEEWYWLVAPAVPPRDGNPSLVEYSINLDTDNIQDFPVRKSLKIDPNWQNQQLGRRKDLMRFKRESGVPCDVERRSPEFSLICLCERLE